MTDGQRPPIGCLELGSRERDTGLMRFARNCVHTLLLLVVLLLSISCQTVKIRKINASDLALQVGKEIVIVTNFEEHCCKGNLSDCVKKTTTFCPSERPISVFKAQ